jgi:hypothetical protein
MHLSNRLKPKFSYISADVNIFSLNRCCSLEEKFPEWVIFGDLGLDKVSVSLASIL